MMQSMRQLLSGIPKSEPGEVVQHPRASLDAQARRIHELENALVEATAELHRHGTKYNTIRADLIRAREGFAETLKESGLRVEYVATPPELEM